MEAKDTIISRDELPVFCGSNTTKFMLETQAEISFKAGINEVVEWIPSLIQKIKDNMWNDDWGIKGVLYEDMLDKLVKKSVKIKLKDWGISD